MDAFGRELEVLSAPVNPQRCAATDGSTTPDRTTEGSFRGLASAYQPTQTGALRTSYSRTTKSILPRPSGTAGSSTKHYHFCILQERTPPMPSFVTFSNVGKIYHTGELDITALHDVNFEIEKGEFCVIVGASGAGKTTILNILGGMDTLTSGQVFLDGQEISNYDKKQLTSYRRFDIGFVFQFYNLVQNLTALENVELAAQICKDPLPAPTVLEEVGLKDRLLNFPAQLSGGEQQRVAIARALAKNPKLLLCDEPTGALDYNTGKAVLKLLQDTCRENGKTVVVITHNQALTAMADRIITVKSGTVVSMEKNEHIADIADIEW